LHALLIAARCHGKRGTQVQNSDIDGGSSGCDTCIIGRTRFLRSDNGLSSCGTILQCQNTIQGTSLLQELVSFDRDVGSCNAQHEGRLEDDKMFRITSQWDRSSGVVSFCSSTPVKRVCTLYCVMSHPGTLWRHLDAISRYDDIWPLWGRYDRFRWPHPSTTAVPTPGIT